MDTRIVSEIEEVAVDPYVHRLWDDVSASTQTPTSTIRHFDAAVTPLPEPFAHAEALIADPGAPVTPQTQFSLIQHMGSAQGIERYTANQVRFGRIVELRIVDPRTEDGARVLQEFLLDAHVCGRLSHPNILPIHEFGKDPSGRYFTCHPSNPGRGWNQILADRGMEENLQILLRVMDAVAFAHSKGYIHRDLKPGNIHVGLYGEVVVSGWGTACEVKRLQRADSESRAHLAGTPAYMAPEVALGLRDQIGIRTDIYQLGAILLEILLGQAPHDADNAIQSIIHAASNPLPDTMVASPLFSIAMRAMNSSPPARFASIAELQKAIRAYLSHQESIRISELADQYYLNASDTRSMDDYATALTLYAEAQNLWRENESIPIQAGRARIEYAACALEAGDIPRADNVLPEGTAVDPEDEADFLRVRLRIRRARRRRAAFRLASLAGIVVLGLVIFFGYRHWLQERYWERVYQTDFSRADADLSGLLFTDSNRRRMVQPNPLEGGLWLEGGQWCWLRDVRIPGDSRLVIRFSTEGVPDSLEMVLNGRNEPVAEGHFHPAGHALKLIIAGNDSRVIHRPTSVPIPIPVGDYGLSIPTHRIHELEFFSHGGRIRVLLNGKPVYDSLSILPLEGEGLESIGFRVWQASTRIFSIRVYKAREKDRPDFLLGGDRLVALGFREKAIDEYLRVAERYPGTRDAENALFKAFQLTTEPQFLISHANLRQSIKSNLDTQFPDSLFNRHIMEEEIVLDFDMGRYNVALQRVQDLQREYPQANIAEKLWERRPPSLPPFVRDALLPILTTHRDTISLDGALFTELPEFVFSFKEFLHVGNNLLADFSRIGSMQSLHSIYAAHNRIENVDFLAIPGLETLILDGNRLREVPFARDCPQTLKVLSLESNRIADLTPFMGMKFPLLDRLLFNRNMIEDISPLQSISPRGLHLSMNRIRSLDALPGDNLVWLLAAENLLDGLPALSGAPFLSRLDLSGNRIRDITPLKGLPLMSLNLDDNRISDLSPLRNMPLRQLSMEGNPVEDGSILGELPLTHLAIGGTAIRDMSPIECLESLELLRMDAAQFKTLDFFRFRKLRVVESIGTGLTDLEPLRSWLQPPKDALVAAALPPSEPLRNIMALFSFNDVETLDPLEGKPIQHLHAEDNRINTLVPLEGMPLHTAFLFGNQISSLEPLRGAPLRFLDVRANRITDLSPLRHNRELTFLGLADNQITEYGTLAELHSLRWLDLGHNEVLDLWSLRHLPLYGLDISHNHVESLKWLSSMPLAYLDCRSNRITSLAGLERRGLVELRCAENRITALDPLVNMPLVSLDCAENPVLNMNLLARIPTLRSLRCDARQLALFDQVATTGLDEIRVVPHGLFREAGRFSGMKSLRHLEIPEQQIDDLSPLAGLQLDYLDVSGNSFQSLGDLARNPPSTFLFDTPSLPTEEILSLVSAWGKEPETARHAHAARVLLAIRANNPTALRSLATPFSGRRYLYVPVSATWEEAKEMAESWGGRLAVLPRRDQNAAAASLLATTDRAWIGLRTIRGNPSWVTGERLSTRHRCVLPHLLQRIFTTATHPDNTRRYAAGISGPRWMDAYGDWYASDTPTQRYAFLVEWEDEGVPPVEGVDPVEAEPMDGEDAGAE